jgi:hypothetical protein
MLKSNGSVCVVVVLAIIAAYFTYQAWFNPRRAIQRRLGELAATLSVPADRGNETDRLVRIARLPNYFAPDVDVTLGGGAPSLHSRDAVVGAANAWNPPPGEWIVSFVDVQVALDSDRTARADLTVEIESLDPANGQPTVDSRDMTVGMAKREGAWVITTVAPIPTPQGR